MWDSTSLRSPLMQSLLALLIISMSRSSFSITKRCDSWETLIGLSDMRRCSRRWNRCARLGERYNKCVWPRSQMPGSEPQRPTHHFGRFYCCREIKCSRWTHSAPWLFYLISVVVKSTAFAEVPSCRGMSCVNLCCGSSHAAENVARGVGNGDI